MEGFVSEDDVGGDFFLVGDFAAESAEGFE